MPELQHLLELLAQLEAVVLRLGLLVLLVIGLFHQIRRHAKGG